MTAERETPTILVIDDDANNLAIVSDYLKGCDFTILVAEDGSSGLSRAAYAKPDLILLDVLMPGMDGYETCRRLKENPATRDIPVIFMTALAETEHKVRGFAAGAVDYVTKPFQREEVLARVSVHLQIRELALRLQEANEQLERRVEQRTAELRNSERRLLEIINFLPDATFAINRSGEIIIWNQTAETYTGASALDMIGKKNHEYAIPFYGERRPTLIDLVLSPSPDIAKLYPYLKIEKGVVTGESYTRSVLHGEAYILGIAAPLRDSEGRVVGAIESVRDITERKKLEEQLRQAQKMEAVGTLAGGVAHDFNNILTGIIGYATLLKLRMGEDNPLAGLTDDILAASERAANLTRSLLTFSRKQPINLKPENLNEVVKRIDKLLLRIIGEDVEFKSVLADRELVVMADSGQMEQVLMNLAANARDAMPDGGVLTITTEQADVDDQAASLLPLAPGSYAVVSVADTGTGMDQGTRQRIFDPFFTTKEIGKGTGLGLSIVYGIIRQHQGAISVASEPGEGTTFRIYLRLIGEEAEATRPAELPPLQGGSETILVAEDDADAAASMTRILQEHGYTVITAPDGGGAVAKFLADRERIDLVLLDVVLPKKDAKSAYQEMEAVRRVPVLYVSGHSADVVEKKGIVPGEDQFLPKPVTPRQLLEKVREVLDRK